MNVYEVWKNMDVGGLIAALSDEDSDVRGAASYALGKIGAPAIEPLVVALSDEDSEVCVGAASALGRIGDPRAVEPLITALSDKNSEVCVGAADALGKIGAPAIEPLVVALSDEDSEVSVTAAYALKKIGEPAVDPLITAISDKNSDVCDVASYVLGEIGEPAVDPLITAISDKNSDVCDVASYVLGEIGEPAVEPLIAALSDGDSEVREVASYALGEIGDPRAVDPLITALSDKYPDVCGIASGALGEIGEPAVEPLIAALSDGDSEVQVQAVESLGRIGDPRAVPALEKAINDYEGDVRGPAEVALAKIKSSDAYKEYLKKPEITLKFPEETFKPNEWKRIEITIKNTGSMHAKKIKIKPSSDIEFRRIPTIPQIDKNETKTMTIGMKPTVMGDVPIDIAITFNDVLDREYASSEEMWLLVAESMPMSEPISTNGVSPRQGQSEYKYQVALSFAGEDRKFAERLAGLLKNKNISIFYDKYEQADLWGKDLYQHLQSVYRDKSQFCVVFLSHAYAQKLWTRHELESAQARAFREHREYVLPIKIDDTEIPGINETMGYIDLKSTSLEEIADMLVKKLSSKNLEE